MSDNQRQNKTVIKQNVRNFTGQVLCNDKPIGTCFVINHRENLIVTSLHVLKIIVQGDVRPNMDVTVYFPQITTLTENKFHTNLTYFHPNSDVAILKVTELNLPDEVTEATYATSQQSVDFNHTFVSYGYNQGKYQPIRGTIGSYLNEEQVTKLDRPFTIIPNDNIDDSLGGAPIFDWTRNLVVGMVSFHLFRKPAGNSSAIAIDLQVIETILENFPQLKHLYPGSEYAMRSMVTVAQSKASASLHAYAEHIRQSLQTPLPPLYYGAPSFRADYPELHPNLIQTFNDNCNDTFCWINGLIGPSGIGKKVLMQQWLNKILSENPPPIGVFWWSFYHYPSGSAFIDSVIKYLEQRVGVETLKPFDTSLTELISILTEKGRFVFILDGLENLQIQDGDDYGLIPQTRFNIRNFLDYFTAFGYQSFCLISSTIPIVNLIDRQSYKEYNLNQLSLPQGRMLLDFLKVRGEQSTIDATINAWESHTLSLALLGGFLSQNHENPISQDMPRPVGNSVYERVKRIIRHYEATLTAVQREFLCLLSIFRVPINRNLLIQVLYESTPRPIEILRDVPDLSSVFQSLSHLNLVQENHDGEYTLHPLISTYFRETLDSSKHHNFHITAFHYYSNNIRRDTQNDASTRRERWIGEALYHVHQDQEIGRRQSQPLMLRDLEGDLGGQAVRNFKFIDNKYLIGDIIESGGQGTVHTAYFVDNRRYVAIKLLDGGTPKEIRRFERGAQFMRDFIHPHIVPLLDFNLQSSPQYIVMPLMRGGTLHERLEKSGTYTVGEMVDLIRKIGSALTEAHLQNIIHRDVKPKNIIYNDNSNPEPYLLDFGLAKTITSGNNDNSQDIAGTALYITPGMRAGREEASAKTDQYALAIVACEMLVGIRIRSETTPPLEGFKIPDSIHNILNKALEIEPNNRYATVKDFVDALVAEIEAHPELKTQRAEPISQPVQSEQQEQPSNRILTIVMSILIVFAACAIVTLSVPEVRQVIIGAFSTHTPTPTHTAIAPHTSTATDTATVTVLPMDTATVTRTPTATDTPTYTISPTDTSTATETATVTVLPTDTATVTRKPTATYTATFTRTSTDTPMPDDTATLPPTIETKITETTDIELVLADLAGVTRNADNDECEAFVEAYEFIQQQLDTANAEYEFARQLFDDEGATIHIIYERYCINGNTFTSVLTEQVYLFEVNTLLDTYREVNDNRNP